MRRAFEREQISSKISRVEDGRQAVRYLQGEAPYADRAVSPFPHVIFTDLKMPLMDGFEVLHWLRSHPKCSLLPTMVFSASAHDEDIEKAYRLGANAYLVKPGTLDALQRTVRQAHDFWIHCSKPRIYLAP